MNDLTNQGSLPTSLRANLLRRRAMHRRYHRDRTKCQILRSQLGFDRVESSCPSACRGCLHYHGKAYGQSIAQRATPLICAMHPYGWLAELPCPDWQMLVK